MEILRSHIYPQGNIYAVLKGQFGILHYMLVSRESIFMNSAAIVYFSSPVYGDLDILDPILAKQVYITVKLVTV